MSTEVILYDSPLIKLKKEVNNIYYDKERYVMGRLLTIIDSLIKESKQSKAVKDMVHEVFNTKTYFWDRLDEELAKFRDKHCPNIEEGYKHRVKADYPHSDSGLETN